MTKTCLSPGCSKDAETVGLCDEHYKYNSELEGTGLVSWKELFLLMGVEASNLRQSDVAKP